MSRIRARIMAILLLFASILLPGAYAECDWEDGELQINVDGICGGDDCDDCHDCDDGDSFWFDFWFDD